MLKLCNFTEKRLWHMSLLNHVPCLCANVVYVPMCLCASVVYMPTCQKHANFSFLHANMPINVQMCHMACQCFNLHANMPNDVPIFHLGMPCAKKHANFSNISLAKC